MTEVFITSSQFDLGLSVIVVCSCCLTWCLGFLAHEFGGK